MDLLLLLRETGSSHLGVLHLVLLKLEITSHVVNLSHRWQLVLPSHGLLHVLEELGNERLTVLDLLFVLGLLVVEFERELVDFLLLLVEDLVFLFLALVASLAVLLLVVVRLELLLMFLRLALLPLARPVLLCSLILVMCTPPALFCACIAIKEPHPLELLAKPVCPPQSGPRHRRNNCGRRRRAGTRGAVLSVPFVLALAPALGPLRARRRRA